MTIKLWQAITLAIASFEAGMAFMMWWQYIAADHDLNEAYNDLEATRLRIQAEAAERKAIAEALMRGRI